MERNNMKMKLFRNKKVRALWDKKNNKYWFSANDICKILIDGNYKKAKSYWKMIKQKDSFFSMENGYVNTQLNLPAKDGKYYNTDVIDIDIVLYLIKTIQHKNNRAVKMYLHLLGVKKLKNQITKSVCNTAKEIADLVKKLGKQIYFSQTKLQHTFVLNSCLYEKYIAA